MKPPAFKILANGDDITRKINDRLERLTVHDAPGVKSDTVTIEIDNRDQAVELPETGAKLEVWIGIGEDLTFKGIYQVTELEEPLDEDALVIHAVSAPYKSGTIKAPKDRTFDKITYGELVGQVAAEHGLTPVISEALASIEFDHIDQKAESDVNLLNRLGRQYDAIAKPVADRLLVTPKGEGKTASGQDMTEIVISDPANSSGRVTITERSDYQAVIAHWFDEQDQKKKAVQTGSGEPVFTMRRQYGSEQEAQDAAAAELAKQQRGKKSFSLERPLTPEMAAEARVIVQNHKASANGTWIAESVDHVIEPDRFSVSSAKLITPKN
ncbi:contractile injection system protein, VgrG/Pvc8 family [Vibrio hippocampi]|uniref:Phage protein D n=1 Tax=Vibrio hippocampi TaxID=654686 RepID=A0ABM8ZPD5_9VIBR|nr:contractile injection system protein, VgrG/Pvc8 family [Vibrio hippocampi]CAH0531135.1 hypothetical protein VHP8226_04118 [Vibrio hippocampi]